MSCVEAALGVPVCAAPDTGPRRRSATTQALDLIRPMKSPNPRSPNPKFQISKSLSLPLGSPALGAFRYHRLVVVVFQIAPGHPRERHLVDRALAVADPVARIRITAVVGGVVVPQNRVQHG